MKWVFLIRFGIRYLALFIHELREGNPYAYGLLVLISVVLAGSAFLKYARRPLGGDPDLSTVNDETFRDENNPYRGV